jgi:calcium/calmodulin-dependent protein kinase I
VSVLFVDEISQEFLAKYHIYHVLGKGAYGVVKKGVSKITKDEVAIKIYDLKKMSQRAKDAIHREVDILKVFDHPNIVRSLDSHSDSIHHFYFVMQLVIGGELLERISKKVRYTEREARAMVKKLLETIKYIHDRDIAHR